MKRKFSRREFLKLISLIPLWQLTHHLIIEKKSRKNDSKVKNVIIVVFDAWSAHNISLLGYQRDTTPNLNRLAESAIVYHNHYSTAPWTVPGTASLLTGTYPWTNRAIDPGGAIEEFQTKNIFNSFKSQGYDTIAYTHNPYADTLLEQFQNNIDLHLPIEKLFINYDPVFGKLFKNDKWASSLAQNQIFLDHKSIPNSLLLSSLLRKEIKKQEQKIIDKYAEQFPREPPALKKFNYYFLLEDAINWVIQTTQSQIFNFLGYFHFWPPHIPYRTRRDFFNLFVDGWAPDPKPEHIFSAGEPVNKSLRYRRRYDEYIAYVDSEFARLYKQLEILGLLEDTWLILTSDHGERFERGTLKHQDYLLHDPVIKIPLIIFPPGNKERIDVYSRTSSIDILPTLLYITGQSIPNWCEGEILPPYRTTEYNSDRSIFAFKPKDALPTSKLTKGAYVIFKGKYKLIYFSGIDETKTYDPYFELYDINNDPEELNNLYTSRKNIAEDLLQELLSKRAEADMPYG